MKKVSGIVMAMCIVAGSGAGAVEASKGIDYYLIKDKEKLIHMSVEDYSSNFTDKNSNYYQHFLKNKYLEIEYLVQEQGKGPKSYSDDKYVYINDFLKAKESNTENDLDVMKKLSGKSFDNLKDSLYKLTFENDKPVYEKLKDDDVVVDEVRLVEGLNSIKYKNTILNALVKNGYVVYVGDGINNSLVIDKIEDDIKMGDLLNKDGKKYDVKSKKRIFDIVDLQNEELKHTSLPMSVDDSIFANYDIEYMEMNDGSNIFANMYHNEIIKTDIKNRDIDIVRVGRRAENALVVDNYVSANVNKIKDDENDLYNFRVTYKMKNGQTDEVVGIKVISIFMGEFEFKEGINNYSVKENTMGNKLPIDEFKIVYENGAIKKVLDKNGKEMKQVPKYLEKIDLSNYMEFRGHIEDSENNNIYFNDNIKSEIKKVIDDQNFEDMADLKVGKNIVYIGDESVEVYVTDVTNASIKIEKILKIDGSYLLDSLEGEYKLKVGQEKIKLTEDSILHIQRKVIDQKDNNKRLKDAELKLKTDKINLKENDNDKLKIEINKKINDEKIEIKNLEILENGVKYKVELGTDDGQRLIVNGTTNFNPRAKEEEAEMINGIREIDLVFNSSMTGDNDNRFKENSIGSSKMFTKTFQNDWTSTPWAKRIDITRSDNYDDVGKNLLKNVKKIDLYFIGHDSMDAKSITSSLVRRERRVKNFKYVPYASDGEGWLEIPLIINADDGTDRYVGYISRRNNQANRNMMMKDEDMANMFAGMNIDSISYEDLMKNVSFDNSIEELELSCSKPRPDNKSHANTLIFRLTFEYGNTLDIGLSSYHDVKKSIVDGKDIMRLGY